MLLHDKQKAVALDPHRFRVLCWGRRAGKTELARDQMKARLTIPNSRVVYVAPTIQQARDIMWEKVRNELHQAGKANESRMEIELVNGSKLFLKGWEAIETLRGQQFDLIVLDEVAMMRNFWSNWQEIIRPTLTDTKGEGMFISTPRAFNHFYDLYNLEAKDTDFKSFHATTFDNPHIPPEEIEKAKKELTEDRFAQEYLADFRKSEGLVYKEFNRFRHVFKKEEGKTMVKTFGGVDFGFTNPCAAITIKKDKYAVYWVTDEWYKTNQTDAQIADYVQALKWEECYPDPESPAAIEELKKRGVNTREVVKNKDSIKNGINVVRELFNTNRLRIHESCQNLIWELETYSYPQSKPDRNEEENPIKEGDHACFVKGTLVNGKKIEEVGVQTGIEDVFEYQIAGETLIATKNHPVLTHRGFVNIDALRYDDVVWKEKKLFMTVSGGIGIRTAINGLKGITISALKRLIEAGERDYTDTFGGKNMGKFRKATTFIILTRVPQIISLITWSLYSAVGTMLITGLKKSENGLKRISRILSNVLQSGLKLLKAGNVGLKWVTPINISYSIEQLLKDNAICVVENIRQGVMGKIDSATLTVVKKHYVGREPVYNLKTKSGMYLANGVMVSNCDALRYALTMDNALTHEHYYEPPIFSVEQEATNPAE